MLATIWECVHLHKDGLLSIAQQYHLTYSLKYGCKLGAVNTAKVTWKTKVLIKQRERKADENPA